MISQWKNNNIPHSGAHTHIHNCNVVNKDICDSPIVWTEGDTCSQLRLRSVGRKSKRGPSRGPPASGKCTSLLNYELAADILWLRQGVSTSFQGQRGAWILVHYSWPKCACYKDSIFGVKCKIIFPLYENIAAFVTLELSNWQYRRTLYCRTQQMYSICVKSVLYFSLGIPVWLQGLASVIFTG